MIFEEYKIEIYVPEKYVEKIRNALNKIGACHVGNYDNVVAITQITGYWRPLKGSNPFDGEEGEISKGSECKMEIRCKYEFVKESIKKIKELHPYEEPLINVIPILNNLFE
ncbi:MAG: divalent cation tolerance protein CutA [Thermotogota bacterium]